ncbi:hypothetical protein BKA70DRAFT_1423786 [Coprinopsis sp. MPI-PUGE-AT-0042]|nr:hypothetical protein BKA70DRAFT_1423786 [Coprinopsis sp. MPI-PUGE-AT-0042]
MNDVRCRALRLCRPCLNRIVGGDARRIINLDSRLARFGYPTPIRRVMQHFNTTQAHFNNILHKQHPNVAPPTLPFARYAEQLWQQHWLRAISHGLSASGSGSTSNAIPSQPCRTADEHFPPSPATSSSSNAGQQRRRSSVGMRRVSPDALIDLDAPTQPRRYVTPSTTSRKEVPAFFGKRAMYSKMPPASDGEDELTEEPPAANATDQEKIEWKRRQNTLAARRSRKRKLQQQQALEDAVEQLSRDKEMWRTRALTLRQLLLSHGILCPDFKD